MKTRNLIWNVIILFAVLVILVSCAGTKFIKEPDAGLKTLLIGQIILNTTEIPKGYEAKETYTSGIEIHLEKSPSGEITKLSSRGKDGYFFMTNPDAKSYRLDKLYLHVYASNYVWTFSCEFPHPVVIQIEDGKVNNLGLISWKANYKLHQHFVDNINHENIKRWFKEEFPESDWNTKEWVNIKILD